MKTLAWSWLVVCFSVWAAAARRRATAGEGAGRPARQRGGGGEDRPLRDGWDDADDGTNAFSEELRRQARSPDSPQASQASALTRGQ